MSGRLRNGRSKPQVCNSAQIKKAPTPISSQITDALISGLCFNLSIGTSHYRGNLARHYTSDGRVPLLGYVPDDSLCSDTAACDLLFSQVISKCKTLGTSTDEKRRQEAIARWYRAEMQCFATNCSFRGYGHLGHEISDVCTSGDVLARARSLISYVLGPLDSKAFSDILNRSAHGKGGTTRLSRRNAGACTKFSGTPEASPAICDFAMWLSTEYPEWIPDGKFTPRSWSKLAYVPKNAITDRVICSEPDLNIFFQKGVGSYWKDRMKKRAHTNSLTTDCSLHEFSTVDLYDQTPNQIAAKYGSSSGLLATVDLSMASDTVSYELVRWLLPHDWFDLINHLRVGSVRLEEGKIVNLEKFSSMGNGYTFELESLIFWAICTALNELFSLKSPVFVYGDDIVVSRELVENGSLTKMLAVCGFNINASKSHWCGPYRESCGKHYFNGDDITPFYVREDVTKTTTLLLTCNNLWRWLKMRQPGWIHSTAIKAVYDRLVSFLPANMRKQSIPDGYGDGALVGDWDDISAIPCDSLKPGTMLWKKFHGWEGAVCYTYIPTLSFTKADHYGVILASLWRLCKKTETALGCWITGTGTSNMYLLDSFLGLKNHDVRLHDALARPDEYGLPVVKGYRRIPIVCRRVLSY